MHSIKKKISFSCFVVACFFIITELFLRLCVGIPTRTLNYSLYDEVPGDYKPNQDFIDRTKKNLPYHVHINAQGFRWKEVSIPKEANVFRILCLGDSFTFGAYVDDKETYPARLESALNREGDPVRYEVINAGYCGYTSSDELDYIKEKGLRLDPDLVILAFYINDLPELTRRTTMRESMKRIRKAEPWKSLVRSSALYNGIRKLHAYAAIKSRWGITFDKSIDVLRENADNKHVLDELWASYFADVGEMEVFLRQYGVPLMLVLFPSRDQLQAGSPEVPQRRLKDFAVENRIPVVDLLNTFRCVGAGENLYLAEYGDTHLSTKGCGVAARALADSILARVLDDKLPALH